MLVEQYRFEVTLLAYLVNEQHTRNQLRNTLVDVLVDHLVYLASELLRDLCLPWLHQLTHHAHYVLPSLRSCVRNVKVV